MDERQTDSGQFVAIPHPLAPRLRVLGPPPGQAGASVDPIARLDAPLAAVQSVIGGICDEAGRLIAPVELIFALDVAAAPPHKQVPTPALLRCLSDAPNIFGQLTPLTGVEWQRGALGPPPDLGPLLYCRKMLTIFEARSPANAQRLRWAAAAASPGNAGDVPLELVVWDGGSAVYGGRTGRCAIGDVKSYEDMLRDQGRVAAVYDQQSAIDPLGATALAGAHACCRCEERGRCYPAGGGYVYAVDRLAVVHALPLPLAIRPLGEWRMSEAARIVGGATAVEVVSDSATASTPKSEYDEWISHRAGMFDRSRPARLLGGESDGRELLEIARLKLSLLAESLAQLDEAWRIVGRPHLAWNDDTIRCHWAAPGSAPGAAWGFGPILRKIGLHPARPGEVSGDAPIPYPPVFSEPLLLPAEVVDAARYFDEPRRATAFIKRAKTEGGATHTTLLLENLGIAWEALRPRDTMIVTGSGWRAVVAPLAERDKNDGEGLPFAGTVGGSIDKFKTGEQFDGCECRWLPRFGEAVDLHAIGQLGLEALFLHDGWKADAYREAVRKERADLHKLLVPLPLEQREAAAKRFIGERCEVDAPNAVWSRRGLLQRKEDRAAARLDAFPPALWQSIITAIVRMITFAPGFSYCPDRTAAAPRVAGGLLLPLVELRGLIALLDDLIFSRRAPAAALRERVSPPRPPGE